MRLERGCRGERGLGLVVEFWDLGNLGLGVNELEWPNGWKHD